MDRLMMEWTETRITDGLERADRSVAALQPDYFHVDEWLFSDLLAMPAGRWPRSWPATSASSI